MQVPARFLVYVSSYKKDVKHKSPKNLRTQLLHRCFFPLEFYIWNPAFLGTSLTLWVKLFCVTVILKISCENHFLLKIRVVLELCPTCVIKYSL